MRRPSGPQFAAWILMGLGVALMRYGRRPHVPGSGMSLPPWPVIVGGVMCMISAGWHLWLRASPYSGPDSTEPDALTTLDLSNARDHSKNG
jgi:hypothetical protein